MSPPPPVLGWLNARARAVERPLLAELAVRWEEAPERSLGDHYRDRLGEATRLGGRIYTPPDLARRLVTRTLSPRLDEAEGPDAVGQLRVLDPACGTGALLVPAFETLWTRVKRWLDPAEAARFALVCLHGQDNDPIALDLCAAAIAAASGLSPELVLRNLRCADSLGSSPPRPEGGGGFDVVLANPPWLSYSGRQRAPGRLEQRILRRFPSVSRWPSTHGMFACLSARLLAPRGRAGLLLPAGVATQDAHSETRRELSRFTRLDGAVEYIPDGSFPEITQPSHLVVLERIRWGVPSRAAWSSPRLAVSGGEPRWLGLAKDKHHGRRRFPPGTFFDPGVHTGNVARKIVRLGSQPEEGCAPIREGRDIHPFALGRPQKRLWIEAPLEAGEYRRIGPKKRYLEARILLRQTAARPVAARHVEPTYFRNSALGCRGVAETSDLALVALLNSATYALLHRHGTADARQAAFPQVKVGALQDLPLPEPGPTWARLEALGRNGEDHPETGLGEALERAVLDALDLVDVEPARILEALAER